MMSPFEVNARPPVTAVASRRTWHGDCPYATRTLRDAAMRFRHWAVSAVLVLLAAVPAQAQRSALREVREGGGGGARAGCAHIVTTPRRAPGPRPRRPFALRASGPPG